jgi:predicted DNA-binding transcriptional regulator YafY
LNEVFYDLLRYGRQAEVIEPEVLRDRIKAELQAGESV